MGWLLGLARAIGLDKPPTPMLHRNYEVIDLGDGFIAYDIERDGYIGNFGIMEAALSGQPLESFPETFPFVARFGRRSVEDRPFASREVAIKAIDIAIEAERIYRGA